MNLFKLIISLLIYLSVSIQSAHADIKVGTVFFYPPFSMSAGTGFDPAFVHLICEHLHEKCEFTPMSFYQLFPALDNGAIDIAAAGITIPVDQSGDYIYSLPYLLSKGTFMVLKSSSADTIDSLKGATLGIIKEGLREGVFYEYLNAYYPKQFTIRTYNTMEDMIDALEKGSVSAAFTHESTAIYWKLNGGGQFKTIGQPFVVGIGIGIMASPKNANLIQKINQQILQLEQQKSYMDLYYTYFLNEH